MRIAVIAAVSLLCAACDQVRSMLPPPDYDGAYVVLEIDRPAIEADHLEQISDQSAVALRAAGIRYVGRGVSEGALRIRLENPDDISRARQALTPIAGHLILSDQADGVIEARVGDDYADNLADETAEQSIAKIERRIQSQVLVEPYGPGRLVVRTDAPVLPEQVLRAVSQRGLIAFHLVKEVTPEASAQGRLPIGAIVAPPYLQGTNPEVVVRRPALVGHIEHANPSTDAHTGEFVVSFQFDAQGAQTFCQITREHTGERFAVLLDGRVITAPTINERICGGSGQISGNFDASSANDLAILMRAGALPLPFVVIAQGVGAPPAP
ncbi:MAG: hypothetical protein NT015_17455 [Alphaproteobacteria bacterium]|nr:hypothetical protein [Alphaproteobacteria bacterium]